MKSIMESFVNDLAVGIEPNQRGLSESTSLTLSQLVRQLRRHPQLSLPEISYPKGQLFVLLFDPVDRLRVFYIGFVVVLVQQVVLNEVIYSQFHVRSVRVSLHHVYELLDT